MLYTETIYTDSQGDDYEAIEVSQEDIEELLGRSHDGSNDDDEQIIAALLDSGAPKWIQTASGYLDEGVWGLMNDLNFLDGAVANGGMEAKMTRTEAASMKVGDRIEGGQKGTEDYDTGRIVAIDGDQVTVAWDSLVETTQHRSLITPPAARRREHQERLALRHEMKNKENLRAMTEMLKGQGYYFTGVYPKDTAQDWLDHGFTAEGAEPWCEIGVWEAWTAAQLRDAGLNPDQVRDAAETLTEYDDGGYTDGDPIYSVCNGDTNIGVLIEATRK